jgi:hypothetical protein
VPGVAGGLVVAAAVAGPGAWAAVTASNPSASTTYTGCLGHTSGSIYDVKQGNAPLATCKTNDKQMKLSAGDITSVAAGTGLTGGATKGDASLSLDPAYALPHGCEQDSSPSAQPDGTWGCGDDGSQGFFYSVPDGTIQQVRLGEMALDLDCSGSNAKLSADNTFGPDGAFFNALVAPLNGTASDEGFPVEEDGTAQIAQNTGGTATYVWDEDGIVVTGTVTWFLEGVGGACQFDGDMIRPTF